MHWALVIYSLTFFHADGRPRVSTFDPQYSEMACRAKEELAREELRRSGFVGICQHFTANTTPVWPWGPEWRPPRSQLRLTER